MSTIPPPPSGVPGMPGAPKSRRAEPTPLAARVDGIRVMWRQPAGDGDGVLTAPDSMIAKIQAAIDAKTIAPVKGVLVPADGKTAPGILAAMHAVSRHSVVVDTMPAEVDDWFRAHRATSGSGGRPEDAPDLAHGVVPLTGEGSHATKERGAMSDVSSLLKRRISFGRKAKGDKAGQDSTDAKAQD